MRRLRHIAALAGLALPVTAGGPGPQPHAVAFVRERDRLQVLLAGKPFTSFHYGARWSKPFLHPVRSASGIVISRGFPLEPREGESADHPWHRGI